MCFQQFDKHKNLSFTNMTHFSLLIFLYIVLHLTILNTSNATNQATNLYKLLKSKRLSSKNKNPSFTSSWTQIKGGPVHLAPQNGLKEADKIGSLPGQPGSVDFDQYAGYVTLGPNADKALFYYFVESPVNSSSKPLVLWLNGGPGCSSFGNGGLLELGPFRVKRDGKTLYRNPYSWNNVANVIFLESPAGVGFSYGKNESRIYEETGDISTSKDAYTFLINWLQRFPEYKTRDFYLTGESYAGHYVPQLAHTILQNNNFSTHHINLKGIAIGNAWIDDATNTAGMYDFFWTHAMLSDETHARLIKHCNFSDVITSDECDNVLENAGAEIGNIDIYNIYAPVCLNPGHQQAHILDSAEVFDPCASSYVDTYLNTLEVQKALHAKHKMWESCSPFDWQDSPDTVLPVIQKLMASNISVWIYSGDVDGRVPVTSSKYSINTLKLPIKSTWRAWYTNSQVGGYVVGYDGLTFVTVRGAGHLVPSYQPERALTMISSFLQGTLPPKSL